jgi:hypothetical protein
MIGHDEASRMRAAGARIRPRCTVGRFRVSARPSHKIHVAAVAIITGLKLHDKRFAA